MTQCEFTFVVRQIMLHISNSLQRRRHFCFDANHFPRGRRGLRWNRNVWRVASSDLSHWQLESTRPNKSLEPTRVGAVDYSRTPVAHLVLGSGWLSFGR